MDSVGDPANGTCVPWRPHSPSEWRAIAATISDANHVVEGFSAIAFLNDTAMPTENDELLRPILVCRGRRARGPHKVVFSNRNARLDGVWSELESGTTEMIGEVGLEVIDAPPEGFEYTAFFDARDVEYAQRVAIEEVGIAIDLPLDIDAPVFRGAVRETVASIAAQACGVVCASKRSFLPPLPPLPPEPAPEPTPASAAMTAAMTAAMAAAPFQRPPYLLGPQWLCEAFGTTLNIEGDRCDTPRKSLWFTQIHEGVHY